MNKTSTQTHTTIAHTDNQKTQNTRPVLIEQFLALFIDNKLELLEFKGAWYNSKISWQINATLTKYTER